MTKVLVYGGYHNYYFYANQLSDSLSSNLNISSFSFNCNSPRFYHRSLVHYLPRLDHALADRLLDFVSSNRITHILNYNTNHFSPYLLKKLRALEVKIAFYANDSLYSRDFRKRLYYQVIQRTISLYHHLYFYREYDLSYTRYLHSSLDNFNHLSLLLPACPSPLNLLKVSNNSQKAFDFAFIGHYEDDGRLLIINQLLKSGYLVFLAGPSWPPLEHKNLTFIRNPLPYEKYLACLGLAKVHIGFTSFQNRDLYTRRYFEVPFTGSVLLARYSPIYDNLSKDLSSIAWFYDHIPLISEAENALSLFHKNKHIISEDQLNSFYSKNSMESRLMTVKEFLRA